MKYTKLFILLLLILGSCSTAEKNIEKDFNSLLEKSFSENEPGGIVMLQKSSKILYLKGFGISDIETKEKINENTIFNTGSISKTFVSNAILILQEEKLLSVSDSIYKFFPDFENEDIAKGVRIEHMLSHTSGLPDLRDVANNEEFYLWAKDTANFEPIKKADTLLFEAGQKFEYSNPAYNGLALIIEQVTNSKWQDFIAERIFKPSGMLNSKITDGSYPDKGVAHAYINDNGVYKEHDYGEFATFAASGNGGIWCSISDLVKYEKAIRDNVFLSEQTIKTSRTVFRPENWNDTIPPYIGYSWFIQEKNIPSNKLGSKIVSHTGSQGGFRAFFVSIPEKDIIYIGLFNRPIDNFSEIMTEGPEILRKYNWLD